jgi:hypothetical protein
MAQMLGQTNTTEQPGTVSVAETLTIRLAGIDRMKDEEVFGVVAKIVDAAKDAGLTMGGGPMSMMEMQFRGEAKAELAKFRATKIEQARAAAMQHAMKSAREKADELAALSNGRIVRVVTVREGAAPAAAAGGAGMSTFYAMMMGGDSSDRSELDASSDLKPITTSVALEVQFAVVSK